MKIKQNFSLILGISIPILMILFVAGSIYLPALFIKPEFNFLYVSGDDYYNELQYFIQDGKLRKSEIKKPVNQNDNPPRAPSKLYLYDTAKNVSREVSLEEAQELNLDSNNISPDGFEVVYRNSDHGIFSFFFYSDTDYNTRYLKGHNVSKKLDLRLSGSYYYNFRFLGWIK